jgi:lipoate synthase
LKSAQKALDKRDFSSSAMAHAMALVKNHVSDFDIEILQRDFSVDEAEQEALVDSVYDTAQHFVSLYDFAVLTKSDDNKSPSA